MTSRNNRARRAAASEDDFAQARRSKILKVVLTLASRGGYEAVQLREVAARSGVALATIYKYYGSRAALLGQAMAQWQAALVMQSCAQTAGATFAERMLSRYKYIFDAFRTRPKLFDALVGLQREGGAVQSFGVSYVPTAPDEELAQLDPEDRLDFVLIVGSTLYSTLHFCVYGGRPFDEGWAVIERVIRKLVLMMDPAER